MPGRSRASSKARQTLYSFGATRGRRGKFSEEVGKGDKPARVNTAYDLKGMRHSGRVRSQRYGTGSSDPLTGDIDHGVTYQVRTTVRTAEVTGRVVLLSPAGNEPPRLTGDESVHVYSTAHRSNKKPSHECSPWELVPESPDVPERPVDVTSHTETRPFYEQTTANQFRMIRKFLTLLAAYSKEIKDGLGGKGSVLLGITTPKSSRSLSLHLSGNPQSRAYKAMVQVLIPVMANWNACMGSRVYLVMPNAYQAEWDERIKDWYHNVVGKMGPIADTKDVNSHKPCAEKSMFFATFAAGVKVPHGVVVRMQPLSEPPIASLNPRSIEVVLGGRKFWFTQPRTCLSCRVAGHPFLAAYLKFEQSLGNGVGWGVNNITAAAEGHEWGVGSLDQRDAPQEAGCTLGEGVADSAVVERCLSVALTREESCASESPEPVSSGTAAGAGGPAVEPRAESPVKPPSAAEETESDEESKSSTPDVSDSEEPLVLPGIKPIAPEPVDPVPLAETSSGWNTSRVFGLAAFASVVIACRATEVLTDHGL